MKRILSLTLALAVIALLSALNSDNASAQNNGNQFGKGAAGQCLQLDDDGDGIPNGKDPDFVKPKDGTGNRFGNAQGAANTMNGKGGGYGPGNGMGNQGIGPRDGTGYGQGDGTCDGTGVCDGTGNGSGTGVCDGTGPKGNGGRRK